jgi:hypothetical protein
MRCSGLILAVMGLRWGYGGEWEYEIGGGEEECVKERGMVLLLGTPLLLRVFVVTFQLPSVF